MTDNETVRIARRRVGTKLGFLIHLTVFVAVGAVLIVVNLNATPHVRWFPFPLAGWGLGLAIHGLAVFLSLSGLRERMIAAEVRKLAMHKPRQ